MPDPLEELLREVKALRSEIRQLRNGDELVARLTKAERQEIANMVLDRLDERFAAERAAAAEHAPTRAAGKGRGKRRYF